MGSWGRIYDNAVFGGLGGLLGWLLFGLLGNRHAADDQQTFQALLGGALIGGAIGYLVVAGEAIRDQALLRFLRLASIGLVLGALGGALGMLVGDAVNYALVGQLGANRRSAIVFLGTMFARGLGWLCLGVAIGLSEGIAARSLGRMSYSTVGGTIGGFVGGAIFGLMYLLSLEHPASAALWSAVGLIILGACIGSLSALVRFALQPASVRVMRGWQEGREYGLDKGETTIGRDEHADIPLFRDMRVEKYHVVIRREGDRFILWNTSAPPEWTRVNDEPVLQSRELRDGDRIQLGSVVLRFQMRAALVGRTAPVRGRPLPART
jgi:MFS family permease